MKARLSLSIDTDILKEVKKVAAKKKISVSEMVENYFKIIKYLHFFLSNY